MNQTTLFCYHLFLELHESIQNQDRDASIDRLRYEIGSGIFTAAPLPPVQRTLMEIVSEWQEEWMTPDLLLVAMLSMIILMQLCKYITYETS